MKSRAQIAQYHQYAGAATGRDRRPPNPIRNPDNPMAQSDALAMIRRSQDLGRDSAFVGYLKQQYKTYCLGDIQYIPDTGDKRKNQQYRDYWSEWMTRCDVHGRFHFIDLLQLSLAGVIDNGRHGFIHHHNEDGTFQLQSVMGYNIGNPQAIYTNPQLVSGVVTDSFGRIVAYDIYKLTISGGVRFVQRVPAAIFSFLNPVESTDEISAKTPLHAVLNDAHDMYEVEGAWMKKIQWTSYQTAVFNVPNGTAPMSDPNVNPLDAGTLGSPAYGKVVNQLPGQVHYGEEGFNVDVIRNETPTTNEADFLDRKLAQIAASLGLPLAFVKVMMGLPGTYTRLISEQAKRAFQHGPLGQKWLERNALNEIKNRAFISGIIREEIPYDAQWFKGHFMYPAHPNVDVGRESKANLEENRQGMRSMADITAEEGKYWEDVDSQLAAEAESKMVKAYEVAERFNKATGQKTTWIDALPLIQSISPNPPPPTEGGAGQAHNNSDMEKLEKKVEELSLKLAKKWDETDHPRNKDGEFSPTESRGSKSDKKDTKKGSKLPTAQPRTAKKVTPNRTSPPPTTSKSERAKAAHVMVDKGIQRYAEEYNEPRIAKALGGVSFPNGEPIDIAIAGANGVVAHGIELKTVVKNSNGKITMKGEAIARKAKWERKNKAKIHTLVIDDTDVFNAKGEGKHDPSKRKIYYANGYGSFRIQSMYQAKDMAEVLKLINTSYAKLPPAAKKR